MIFLLSSKNAAALSRSLGADKKCNWAEIMPKIPAGHEFSSDDQVYIDVSDFSPAELKKVIGQIKKSGCFWGIIDPKGAAEDPASFFFIGAGDYIGPALVKKGLDKKRFAEALSWAAGAGGKEADKTEKPLNEKKGPKLPTQKFKGWKSIRTGTTDSFFFIFVSLSGKTNLRALVGESVFNATKTRLRDVLQQGLREANALPWMETEDTSLFLVPGTIDDGKAAVEAALKLILNSQLISIEKLLLSVKVDFTIAMHYGKTIFQAPGKTGAVISESVNYIFHLGTKKAEGGRLTITDDVPDEAVPDELKDLFVDAGVFENIPIRHSKRIIYE